MLSTVTDVLKVWEKAWIPTRKKSHVVEKLNKLNDEWVKLKKNKENKKKTKSQNLLDKQDKWNSNLDDLFNVAHANAFNLMDIEEDKDKEFLKLQRERGRKDKMTGVDKAI